MSPSRYDNLGSELIEVESLSVLSQSKQRDGETWNQSNRDGETWGNWFIHQMASGVRSGPSLSQKPETPVWVSHVTEGAHLLEPSSSVFPRTLVRSWVGSGTAGSQN